MPDYLAAAVRDRCNRLDVRITATLARLGVPVLRMGLRVVFLWFGALKFSPGLSRAQDLATRTIQRLSPGLVGPEVSLPVLAGWEVLIGLGLLSGRLLRATLFLLALQMAGTMVVGATVHGGRLVADPHVPHRGAAEGAKASAA